jgi:hypothetical protein
MPLDVKFRVFICHALNENQLGDFFKTITDNQVLMNKFFDKDALIMRDGMKQKFVDLLMKLQKLPFAISLIAEVF